MKAFAATAAVLLSLSALTAGAADPAPASAPGDLQPLEGTQFQRAWVAPGTDFTRYARVAILDAPVTFKKDWKRNHRGVRDADMEKITSDLAVLFKEKFTRTFEDSGMKVVNVAAKDVIVIRAALTDLDVYAPERGSMGATRTYAGYAGGVTLYVELVDSSSGKLVARFMERGGGMGDAEFMPANNVNALGEASELLVRWSEALRDWIRAGGAAPTAR